MIQTTTTIRNRWATAITNGLRGASQWLAMGVLILGIFAHVSPVFANQVSIELVNPAIDKIVIDEDQPAVTTPNIFKLVNTSNYEVNIQFSLNPDTIISYQENLGNITITPLPNQNGNVTVSYEVTYTDNSGTVQVATNSFQVIVNPVDDPVTANSMQIDIPEDTTTNFQLSVDDVDGDNLTFELITDVDSEVGTLEFDTNSRTQTFIPKLNVVGTTFFIFNVSDNVGSTSQARVTINVTPVNDAPEVSEITSEITMDEDTEHTVTLNVTDVEKAAHELDYELVVSNPELFASGYPKVVTENGQDVVSVDIQLAPNATGSAQFTLNITDLRALYEGGVDYRIQRAFVVNVTPINDAPIASGIEVDTDEDNPVEIILEGSDIDSDSVSFIYEIISTTNGVVTFVGDDNGPTVNYQPNANFNGVDTFKYQVKDNDGAVSNTATVTVTVRAVNDSPTFTINPQVATEDVTHDVVFTVNDEEGPVSDFEYGFSVNNDNLFNLESSRFVTANSSNDVTLRLVPVSNANGTASITVTVTDNASTPVRVVTQLFTITVNAVNDAPTFAMAQTAIVVTEDAGAQTITDFLTGIGAVETDQSITIVSVDVETGTELFDVAPQLTTTNTNAAILTYTSTTNLTQTATASLVVTVVDSGPNTGAGDVNTTTASFTIRVDPVNDAPTFTINPQVATEDVTHDVVFTVNDEEGPVSDFEYGFSVNNDNLFNLESSRFVTANSSNDVTLRLVPVSNANGTARITVTVTDNAHVVVQTFTITVNAVNDPPELEGDTVDLDYTEQTDAIKVVSSNFTITDIENLPNLITSATVTLAPESASEPRDPYDRIHYPEFTGLNVSTSTTNHALTVTITGNQVREVYAVFLQGLKYDNQSDNPSTVTRTIRIQVNDGELDNNLSNTLSRKIVFTAVNDAPTLDGLVDVNVDEDHGVIEQQLTVGDVDDGFDSLNFEIVSSNGTLFSELRVVTANGVATLNMQFSQDMFGFSTVEVIVSDPQGATASQVITVTVNAVNDAPTASGIEVDTAEDTPVEIILLGSDIDTGDRLTYEIIDTTNGVVTFVDGGNGPSVNYRPNEHFNGVDTFTYQVRDRDEAVSNIATVTVNVTAVNDAPTLGGLVDVNVDEDHVPIQQQLTVGDVDDGFDSLNFEIVSSDGTLFSQLAVVTANGVATLNMQFAQDMFGFSTVEVIVSDPQGATASQVITVTVNAVNDAPTIISTYNITVTEDASVTFSVQHSDVDTATITYEFVSSAYGELAFWNTATEEYVPTLSVTSNTQVTARFTPMSNLDTASFDLTFNTSDGQYTMNSVVNVTLNALNDPPELAGDTVDLYYTEQATAIEVVSDNFEITDVDTDAKIVSASIVLAMEDGSAIDSADVLIYPTEIEGITSQNIDSDNQKGIELKFEGGTSHDNFESALKSIQFHNQSNDPSPVTRTIRIRVNDGELLDNLSYTFSRKIVFTAVNDAPKFTILPTAINVNEDADEQTIIGFLTGIDAVESGQGITRVSVNVETGAALFSDEPTLAWEAGSKVATLTYTPTTSLTATATARLVVTVVDTGPIEGDDDVNTTTASFTITVAPQNDAPSVPNLSDFQMYEDGSITVTFNVIDDESPATAFNYTFSYDDTSAFNVIRVKAINNTTAQLEIELNPNINGTKTIGVTITDVIGYPFQTITEHLKVDITPVNDAPTVTTNLGVLDREADEESVITYTLQAFNRIFNDIDDNDILQSILITATPDAQLVQMVIGSDETALPIYPNQRIPTSALTAVDGVSPFKLIGQPDASGTTSFQFKVSDGNNDSTTAYTVTVTFNEVNDAPTFNMATTEIGVTEDAGMQLIPQFLTAINPIETNQDIQLVTVNVISGITVFDRIPELIVQDDWATLTFTPTTQLTQTVTATMMVTVVDSGQSDGNTTTASFTIRVDPVNDSPTAGAIWVTVSEDAMGIDISHLGDDEETPSPSLGLSIVSTPNQGRVEIVGVKMRYIPTPNGDGDDLFHYRVSDGMLQSNIATVSITIIPENDPPTVTSTVGLLDHHIDEDQVVTFSIGQWTSLFVDPDRTDQLQAITLVTPPQSVGQVMHNNQVLVANTRITSQNLFMAPLEFRPFENESGTTSFQITVSDGITDSATAYQIVITVNAVNDTPIATAREYRVTQDQSLTFQLDITDPDHATWSIELLTSPNLGEIESVSDTGVVVYTPNPTVFGIDGFRYRVSDGQYQVVSHVTLNITDVNDMPTALHFMPNVIQLSHIQAKADAEIATLVLTDDTQGSNVINLGINANIRLSQSSLTGGGEVAVRLAQPLDPGQYQIPVALNNSPLSDELMVVVEDATVNDTPWVWGYSEYPILIRQSNLDGRDDEVGIFNVMDDAFDDTPLTYTIDRPDQFELSHTTHSGRDMDTVQLRAKPGIPVGRYPVRFTVSDGNSTQWGRVWVEILPDDSPSQNDPPVVVVRNPLVFLTQSELETGMVITAISVQDDFHDLNDEPATVTLKTASNLVTLSRTQWESPDQKSGVTLQLANRELSVGEYQIILTVSDGVHAVTASVGVVIENEAILNVEGLQTINAPGIISMRKVTTTELNSNANDNAIDGIQLSNGLNPMTLYFTTSPDNEHDQVTMQDFLNVGLNGLVYRIVRQLGYIDDAGRMNINQDDTTDARYYPDDINAVLADITDSLHREEIVNHHQGILAFRNQRYLHQAAIIQVRADAIDVVQGKFQLKESIPIRINAMSGELLIDPIGVSTIAYPFISLQDNTVLRMNIDHRLTVSELSINNAILDVSEAAPNPDSPLIFNQLDTTCGQQYTLFNAEKINGEFEAVRLPDNGCEWDISQLYSQGIVQELAFEESYLKGSQTVSQFRTTPVVQNQPFYVGFRYYPAPDETVPFTPILRIFDAMGQLHLETPVTLYSENAYYQYYRIHIQPDAFHRMAVGVYVMTISDQNTLKSKVKMSVFPQKIE